MKDHNLKTYHVGYGGEGGVVSQATFICETYLEAYWRFIQIVGRKNMTAIVWCDEIREKVYNGSTREWEERVVYREYNDHIHYPK